MHHLRSAKYHGPQTIQGRCKMYEGPEFRHLQYFIAVAEEFNFGRAAERLHVSQPSLSAQIKQLEGGLGGPLFLRGHAGTSLTTAGHAFLPHARQMLAMRARAVETTTAIYRGGQSPFRFGYSPFINHELVREAIRGYRALVPEGIIEPSSECSGPLSTMVAEGRLDAALVTFPIAEEELVVQFVCTEELLVCLRTDDPLAQQPSIPRTAVQKRLKVFFNRTHHPLLYDDLMRRFDKAGIKLELSDFVSAPSEMQFLVKENVGFGLIQDRVPIDADLTRRKIEGLPLRIKTALACYPAQQRPMLQLLGYRLAKVCAEMENMPGRKRPSGRIVEAEFGQQLRMFA